MSSNTAADPASSGLKPKKPQPTSNREDPCYFLDREKFFPTLNRIPSEMDGLSSLALNMSRFVLLTEITDTSMFNPILRYRLALKDQRGKKVFVVYYLDNDAETQEKMREFAKQVKVGRILAITNPVMHGFLDLSHGIREDDLYSSRIVPCSFANLDEAKELMRKCALGEDTHCEKCQKEAADGSSLKKCGSCKAAKYCSKECQQEDWPNHKKFCKAIKPLELLVTEVEANEDADGESDFDYSDEEDYDDDYDGEDDGLEDDFEGLHVF